MNLEKLLQTLKSDIRQKETILKALHKNYPHLIHLSEKQILTYFEVASLDELPSHSSFTIQYSKDQDHHSKQNISVCSCTDSQGRAKDLYESEASAQQKSTVFIGQKKIRLKVYLCPNGCGWHLTKG